MAERRTALAGLILIFLIIIGDIVSGAIGIASPVTVAIAGCNNPSSLEQCGSGNCIPTGAPVQLCTLTINFNPAFTTIPTFASATLTGCHTPECHFETGPIPTGTLSFQSDNGETWASMPVAKTEIYGTTSHEIGIFTQTVMNNAQFMVNCITGSASATATLRPEYSLDGGGTWNQLAQNPGGLDALVDAGDCAFSPVIVVGPSGIASAAAGSSIILRIVGINGNGIGDAVTFNNLELVFFSQWSETYMTCIQGISPFICPSGFAITKTSMTISIVRSLPTISGLGTSISVNWIASV